MRYQTDVEGIDTEHLAGFFVGWAQPPSADKHLALLHGSSHVVLAREHGDGPLVGFVSAVSDGVLSAYIAFLEVRPEFRGQGIGTELVTRLLVLLGEIYMIDVMCDVLIPSGSCLGDAHAWSTRPRGEGLATAAETCKMQWSPATLQVGTKAIFG